mmetsp:Transcript_45277/g.144270  ORF Transcript_45277/g.144270 Transcript_45277/m.144270 type:complete len:278 (+) Transcript_45277:334-1167(+)
MPTTSWRPTSSRKEATCSKAAARASLTGMLSPAYRIVRRSIARLSPTIARTASSTVLNLPTAGASAVVALASVSALASASPCPTSARVSPSAGNCCVPWKSSWAFCLSKAVMPLSAGAPASPPVPSAARANAGETHRIHSPSGRDKTWSLLPYVFLKRWRKRWPQNTCARASGGVASRNALSTLMRTETSDKGRSSPVSSPRAASPASSAAATCSASSGEVLAAPVPLYWAWRKQLTAMVRKSAAARLSAGRRTAVYLRLHRPPSSKKETHAWAGAS